MFNQDFFPTPTEVIERMLEAYSIENKVVLEPSAGKGDIVVQLKIHGAKDVIACEKNDDLRKIVDGKCKVIANDFLTVTSDMISHVDFIIMNPPFSADEKHILHAFGIAPAGCTILSLANLNTVKSCYTETRKRLKSIIEQHGSYENFGECFSTAERKTNVEIAFIKLQKPGGNYNNEFDGFYLEDEPEEAGENGLMSYNVVRDLVNRYIGAVKIYDEQLNAAVKMNQLTSGFYSTNMAMTMTEENKPVSRNEFKKEMQKAGWKFIFEKMNMQKYATQGLKEDINKFVEKQTNIPFTMKNIYKMLEIVIGTTSSRMDRALVEVFDRLTKHHNENRYGMEGWQTNSHFMLNEKFIMPWLFEHTYGGGISVRYGGNVDLVEDLMKAMCYITGDNYDSFLCLHHSVGYRYKLKVNGGYVHQYVYHKLEEAERQAKELYDRGIKYEIEDTKPEWGQWFKWGYFEIRGYKKGTVHFKFISKDLWAQFNQRIAKIKGYPLPEFKEQTAWQKRQNKSAA